MLHAYGYFDKDDVSITRVRCTIFIVEEVRDISRRLEVFHALLEGPKACSITALSTMYLIRIYWSLGLIVAILAKLGGLLLSMRRHLPLDWRRILIVL